VNMMNIADKTLKSYLPPTALPPLLATFSPAPPSPSWLSPPPFVLSQPFSSSPSRRRSSSWRPPASWSTPHPSWKSRPPVGPDNLATFSTTLLSSTNLPGGPASLTPAWLSVSPQKSLYRSFVDFRNPELKEVALPCGTPSQYGRSAWR